MKRLLTFALTGALLTGCLYNYGSDKPLTGQIPSTDKFKLEGTKISSRAMKPADDGTYAVWQRLYDTTWYQTEKEFDDGRLEVETEFVFFNADSSVFEVEVENGRAERPDRDDYAVLTPVKEITYTSENRPDGNDQNAWIVSKLDGEGELEFEAYWLYKEDILYITEGDSVQEAEQMMTFVMDYLFEGDDTERYLLSVSPAPDDVKGGRR